MSDIKVMTIFGTRPEAIKMAPLALELQRRPGIQALCCVTAQHREMLDSVLNIFKLKPDYDLNIMEPRQTLSTITSKCLLGMEGVLEEAKFKQDMEESFHHKFATKPQVVAGNMAALVQAWEEVQVG